MLEVGAGSGFNCGLLKYNQNLLENNTNIIEIICSEPILSSMPQYHYKRQFFDPILTISDLEALSNFCNKDEEKNIKPGKVLFVSRALDFFTETSRNFITVYGGLIIIMLGETLEGCCATPDFYDLLIEHNWKTKQINNGIIEWHFAGKHDVFEIHYHPDLEFITHHNFI